MKRTLYLLPILIALSCSQGTENKTEKEEMSEETIP